MNFRLPLVAALALLVGACSQTDRKPAASGAGAAPAGAMARIMSPAAASRGAVAYGYRDRFAAAPDHGSLLAYPQAPVVRRDGAYTSYLASVSEAHARDAIGGVLTLPLPTGEQLRFRYERHVEHPNGDWTWIGGAVGDKGQQAIITFGAKAAFGTIGQAGAQPWRLTVQNGVSWLIHTDAAQLATINNGATRPTSPDYIVPPGQLAGAGHRAASSGALTAPSSTAAAATTATAANTVDLVIGYTPGFVGYYGGDSQAQTRLNNMVDITNEAYVNSGVDARVRLVKTLQVSYADNTSNDSALEALTGFKAPSTQTTPDPAFSALRAARDQYGADLVSLVRRFQTPENDGCGIAWLIGGGQSPIDSSDAFFGYSVVSDGKDAGTDGKNYYCREETLAHELGHNMGAQHDRATAQGTDGTLSSDEYGRYPYSFGYKTTSTTGNFYTIMAYGDSGQTSYRIFSNPRSTYCGGLACGVDNQADNARTLSQTIPAVATFRSTLVADQPTALKVKSDIDGDGRSDLVLQNASSGLLAYWTMSGATPVRYSDAYTQPAGYVRAAAGDFNGDGKLDIVWARASDRTLVMWLGTGTGFTVSSVRDYAAGWEVTAAGDIDGDGRSDLVLQNASSGLLAYWTMSGATPVRYSDAYTQPAGYVRAAAGDFNGDGKLDIVWARASDRTLVMWLGTGTGFTVSSVRDYAAGWEVTAAGDIDGDGRSDLVLQNASSGLLAYWTMSGATPVRYSDAYTQPAGYVRAAAGDFNGDGKLDIVWARASDRTLVMWLGTGTGFTVSSVRDYAAGWRVVSDDGRLVPLSTLGDIDGDGRSDLVLQNASSGLLAYWTMSGATPVRYSDAYTQPAGYVRAAAGDFNGDGKLDIVWARASDRTLVMWLGTGTGFTVSSVRDYAAGWEVTAAGDIDGDGRSDLVLQNASSGLLAYWTMSGATPVRYSDAYTQPAGYVRAAAGDFNGDGKLDIVWARASDRTLVMWLGTGTGFTVSSVRDYAAGWEVTAAGDIDGDGRSDLVLQNASSGLLAYWTMSGATPVRYSDAYTQPAGYVRAAAGDFNGDGKLDIVWARASDRTLVMWLGTGTGFTVSSVRDYAAGWEVLQP